MARPPAGGTPGREDSRHPPLSATTQRRLGCRLLPLAGPRFRHARQCRPLRTAGPFPAAEAHAQAPGSPFSAGSLVIRTGRSAERRLAGRLSPPAEKGIRPSGRLVRTGADGRGRLEISTAASGQLPHRPHRAAGHPAPSERSSVQQDAGSPKCPGDRKYVRGAPVQLLENPLRLRQSLNSAAEDAGKGRRAFADHQYHRSFSFPVRGRAPGGTVSGPGPATAGGGAGGEKPHRATLGRAGDDTGVGLPIAGAPAIEEALL